MGPFTAPLSHKWVLPHLHRIQDLTIERDYTKFAGSHKINAEKLSFKVAEKIRQHVYTIVQGLTERRDGMRMAQLHIMARKYAGNRQSEDESVSARKYYPSPMCLHQADLAELHVPVEVQDDVIAILLLRNYLNKCRISGYSRDWTTKMLFDLFPKITDETKLIVPRDNPWDYPPAVLAEMVRQSKLAREAEEAAAVAAQIEKEAAVAHADAMRSEDDQVSQVLG